MNSLLNRYLATVWVAALLSILSGAFITSSKIGLTPNQPVPSSTLHVCIATVALLLTFLFCIWVSRAGIERYLVLLAWAGFAAFALSGIIGAISPLSPWSIVCHAVLAHLSLGLMTAAAALVWLQGTKGIDQADPGSWTALRPMALITPLVVLVQIAMGALYRHEIVGVMPHMLGAMVVAILTLVVSVILLQNFRMSRQLTNAATGLISIVLVQVCLGVAVFIMVLLDVGSGPLFAWLATAHVSVGALTFAASAVAAIYVKRLIAERSVQ